MINRWLAVLLCLVICTSAGAQAGAQDSKRRLQIGLQAHKITVDGRERTYRLVVPPRVSKPMPLVLVLHGGGLGELGARHIIGYTKFTRLALSEKFIVVYPMGVDGGWNDGRGADSIRAQRENIDDVKFIRSVVDQVARHHAVDRSRIFSTGISNGAMMSNRLAAEASDLVTAVAPVVGGMAPSMAAKFSPKYPVSAMFIMGTADPLVPLGGGSIGRGDQRGATIALTEIVQKYTRRNGIRGKPSVSTMPDVDPDDGTTTQLTSYRNGQHGSRVAVYVVNNGGHTWPGTKQYLPVQQVGKTSQDFNATELIWKFFESCPPR